MNENKKKKQLPTLDADELRRVSGGDPSSPSPWLAKPPRQLADPSPQPW